MNAAVGIRGITVCQIIEHGAIDIHAGGRSEVGHAVIAAVIFRMLHDRRSGRIRIALPVEQDGGDHYPALAALGHYLVQLGSVSLVHVIGLAAELILHVVIAALYGIYDGIQHYIHRDAPYSEFVQV